MDDRTSSWDVAMELSSQPPLLLVVATLCVLPVVVYFITGMSFLLRKSSKAPGTPPTVPYLVPFLGGAISLTLDPFNYLASAKKMLGSKTAFGLQVLNKKLFYIYGTEDVAVLWRQYGSGYTSPDLSVYLFQIFGLPQKSADVYYRDQSGLQHKPTMEIKPENRVDYHMSMKYQIHMNGEQLVSLFNRWVNFFTEALPAASQEWTSHSDMMSFWLLPTTAALNRALMGDLIDSVNPDFHREFVDFFPYINAVMTGVPLWCLPRARALRDSLLRDVKQWAAIARRRFREADIDEEGHDPWWGSHFMRDREEMFNAIQDWSPDASAAVNLGNLWGSAVNVFPASTWSVIEVLADPTLVRRVRAELASVDFRGIHVPGEMEKVLALPLQQAVYAESLRLHTDTQSFFYNHTREMRVNEWHFPKQTAVCVPNAFVMRDETLWNTQGGRHPASTFWPDRWLTYPGDPPHSGPLQPRRGGAAAKPRQHGDEQAGQPKFVSGQSGMANAYFPYGIGERICPGRHLAKRLMMGFCAELVWRYDIELLEAVPKKMSLKYYALGTERPAKNVPFRMRERVWEDKS